MRKRLSAIALLIVLIAVALQAQGLDTLLTFDHETKTVSTSSVGLTSATYAPTSTSKSVQQAFAAVEGCAVRFWKDYSDPTATVGVKAFIGDIIPLSGREVSAFRAIRDTSCAADATLTVVYRR